MSWGMWGTAAAFAMTVGMLALVVLVVAALALLFRPIFRAGQRESDRKEGDERRP